MTSPLISVVMPVYNGEKHLKEAIDSILNQTFTDFEFIILNDGSTDGTEEIIFSYNDDRIRYIKNKTNLKIVKTLNKGIDAAKGSWIARMDADDVSLPDRIQTQYAFIQKNPHISVCGTALSIYEKPEIVYIPPATGEAIKAKLLFECCLYHPTVMFKKDTILSQGGYNPLFSGAEDYELWQRLSNNKSIYFANLEMPLLRYRKHFEVDRSKYLKRQKKLTSLIIKKQLKQLQIDFNNESFLYHDILSSSRPIKLNKLYECSQWLNKIEKNNIEVNIYSQVYLKEELERRWFNLCYISVEHNPLVIFKFFSRKMMSISISKLANFSRIIWRSRLFFIKSI